MLPLDPLGALVLGANLIAATVQVDPAARASGPLPTTTAVEGALSGAVMVDLLAGHDLGCFKGVGCGLDAGDGKRQAGGQGNTA